MTFVALCLSFKENNVQNTSNFYYATLMVVCSQALATNDTRVTVKKLK